jgi:hypothetical protein
MQVGETDGAGQIEPDRPFLVELGILAEQLAPAGILQIEAIAVCVPLAEAALAIDAVDVLVRGGIVGRHGRPIGIERIEIPAAAVLVDREAGHVPAGVVRFFSDQAIRLGIGLAPPEGTAATAGEHAEQDQRERAAQAATMMGCGQRFASLQHVGGLWRVGRVGPAGRRRRKGRHLPRCYCFDWQKIRALTILR